MGMIPIDRTGGDQALDALAAASRVLAAGELLGMFPEGTRSRDGRLHKGRTGAARLAPAVGCPIFPVGIVGTDAIQPPGARAPMPFKRCAISIGRPIRPERYRDRPHPHLAWRSMIDEVMFEIRELTGQTYRDCSTGRPDDTTTGDPHAAEPVELADVSPRSNLEGQPVDTS